ncbi:chemotaxis protein CheB [Henriciella sp. AS95]|uniref:chemotaxis protein CheB n=1 Tax=Henriciella sp. AS95 TaxID=3135782 RepID=UPI003171831A
MTKLPNIVAIGASAGGLEALQLFVQAIPNDSGLAYVVIQHLAPDQPSLMDKLLGAHTPVPVERIEDGASIKPDHIYIIPPGPFLEIENGVFKLVEHEREEGVRTPIDRFFKSLAEEAGRQAFAVVLSGTGSDGTLGVRAIKTYGGIALVQESGSARFPGMPDSAAATGLVDFVLRPQDMPGRIIEIVRHREQIEESGGREDMLETVEQRLDEVLEQLEEDASNSFGGYKPGTLVRRIARRMTLLRQSSLDGYLQTLADKPQERKLLTQDFLIGVTKFFRDPEAFQVLKEQALEPLLDSDCSSFRVWVPGCSTGEEAYSIAMLACELADAKNDKRPWKIFGTDIDLDALRHARTGRFAEAAMEGLSKQNRDQFFAKDNDLWHVNSRLREMCVFAPHNLLADPPFSKLDLVSCRNVMIYLNADSQAMVLPRFHYALNPRGYLWLGPSETLGRNERYFQTVDRAARLFQRDDSTPAAFSALSVNRRREGRVGFSTGLAPSQQQPKPREPDVERVTEQMFLQRRAAPFAAINRQNEVVYLSEAMTSLIKPSRGAPSTSLDDFLTAELRLPVHSALDEARRTGLEAEIANIVTNIGDTPRLFDVAVTPFGSDSDLMLVSLNEVRQRDSGEITDSPDSRTSGDYEEELILTRKRLSSLEQEFETSEQELRSANEELLSMNEELQSSNEELETSREELQSINEELETINAELSENNRQLTRANSDMRNLLESTDIATLFLDQADCVRLYTPELNRLFGVQERDVGRPIHDMASKVEYPDLATDADQVRRTLQPIERELRIEATDETFQARVRPYRTVDNRIDGVVITFVDVTFRKRNERQLEDNAKTLSEQYSELETLYDTAPVGLSLADRDLRYLRINERLASINGLPAEAHVGKLQEDLLPSAHEAVYPLQRKVLETGEPIFGHAVSTQTPAEPGKTREFLVDFYPVKSGEEVVAIGSCVREVTAERELERRIAESAIRQGIAVDAAGLGIFEWDMSTDDALWENERMFEIFGRTSADGTLTFEEFERNVLHSEDQERFAKAVEASVASGNLDITVRIRRRDGEERFIQYYARVGQVQNGAHRMIGTVADVTDKTLSHQRETRQRQRMKTIQDSLNAFVGLLDPDGTVIEINAPALERGGLERDDVIGRKFWDCWWWSFSEDSKARLKEAVESAAQGESIRYDVPVRMAEGEMIVIDFQLVPRIGDDGEVEEIIPSAVDVNERVEAERRKDLLLAELEHRVKNILATVQAVARFTARMSQDKDQMAESLIQRLGAISRTHDALTSGGWKEQTLRALAESEVDPYANPDDGRFTYSGDEISLSPAAALSMGLALHELATNAAKYGAFSSDSGRVELFAEGDGDAFSRIEWRERGGPPVAPPEHQGFGTFLIQRLLERELDATIRVLFEREGLCCIIEGKETLRDGE